VTEAEWLAATDPEPMLELLRSRGRVRAGQRWVGRLQAGLAPDWTGKWAGDRKLWMFALACCRRVDGLLARATMPSLYTPGACVDPREALPLAEKLVEGEMPPAPWPVNQSFYLATAVSAADHAMAAACHAAADFFHENRRARSRRIEPLGTAFERRRVRGRTLVGVLTSYETRLAVARAAAGPALPDGGEQWRAAWQNAERAEAAAHAVLVRCLFGNPFVAAPTLKRRWLAPDGAVFRLAATIYADRAFDRLPILADALEDAGCDNADILNHCRQPGEHVRGCWVLDLLLGKG